MKTIKELKEKYPDLDSLLNIDSTRMQPYEIVALLTRKHLKEHFSTLTEKELDDLFAYINEKQHESFGEGYHEGASDISEQLRPDRGYI